jgi:hypothetical protein
MFPHLGRSARQFNDAPERDPQRMTPVQFRVIFTRIRPSDPTVQGELESALHVWTNPLNAQPERGISEITACRQAKPLTSHTSESRNESFPGRGMPWAGLPRRSRDEKGNGISHDKKGRHRRPANEPIFPFHIMFRTMQIDRIEVGIR